MQLNRNDAHAFKVSVPSDKKEQSAIVNLQSDMVVELDALNLSPSKTQQIKQGMMQELLTGSARLV